MTSLSDPASSVLADPVVQVRRLGSVAQGTTAQFARLRDLFHERHCVRLTGFLEPELVRRVLDGLEHEEFVDRVHEGIASNREFCLRPGVVSGLLHVLLNGHTLFRIVEGITGCGAIGSFTGRVYQVKPGVGHHDAWHSDWSDHRLIGLSINLSSRPFRGGVLQLRNHASRRMICEMPNPDLGDALLFRLSPDLQHRITDMEGTTAKTAFAGWFRSQPDIRAWFAARRITGAL